MRVQRTFAFVDLCGFTRFTEDHGDEAAVQVLAQLRMTLRAAAERRGVRVTKWLGDGAMLSGIDARAVVACVLEVRDSVAVLAPLPLRGGIAGGEAIMFEGDDYVGAVVNVAARLAGRAKPNQILATAQVTGPMKGLVTMRPCTPLCVPGITRPIDVHELLAVPLTETPREAGPSAPSGAEHARALSNRCCTGRPATETSAKRPSSVKGERVVPYRLG